MVIAKTESIPALLKIQGTTGQSDLLAAVTVKLWLSQAMLHNPDPVGRSTSQQLPSGQSQARLNNWCTSRHPNLLTVVAAAKLYISLHSTQWQEYMQAQGLCAPPSKVCLVTAGHSWEFLLLLQMAPAETEQESLQQQTYGPEQNSTAARGE